MALSSPLYDSYEDQQLLGQVGPDPQAQDAQEDQLATAREAAIRQRVLGGYTGESGEPYEPSPAKLMAIGGPAPAAAPAPAPPDTLVTPPAAAPAAPEPGGWVTPTDAAGPPISLWRPEDAPPEAQPGVGSELVGGALRGGAHMLGEGGRLLATAMRKTAGWTEQQWLQEGAKAVDEFSTQTEEAAAKKYPLGSMSMKDAYDKGQIWPWLAGKATEQALPIGAILGMARLTGPMGPIIYGALVGANEESRKPDASNQSILSGAGMGAASMGLPIGVAKAVAGSGLLTRILGGVAGFAGLGAAGTFEEPVQKVVRGGEFEAPTAAQVAEGAVVGGLAGPVAAIGTGARPREAPPPTADTRPPPVDPAIAEATRLALPPPSPENRAPGAPLGLPAPTLENRPPTPDVINVPPGEGQVSPADIVAVPPGAVDRPPIPGLDPDVAAAAQRALPAPSPENRAPPSPDTRPPIPVPPEAGQVSPADIVAVPPGAVDRPPLRPATDTGEALPPLPPGPERPPPPPSPPLRQGELPGVEPAPPQGELPLRQPPPAPATEGLPRQPELPLGEQPSLPFKLADPAGWRVEEDDATRGQFVVKHGPDVLSVGSSPEEALGLAHQRAQRAVAQTGDVARAAERQTTTGSELRGTPSTGETGPVVPAAAAPPAAAAAVPTEGVAGARATRRAQMKSAAQEVLAKAEAAKPAATGEKPVVAELMVKPETAPPVTPHVTAVHELPSGKFGVTVNGEAAGVKTGYSTREQAQAIADRARQLSELPQWNAKPVATLVAKAASIVKGTAKSAAATRAEIEATNARLTREDIEKRTPSTKQFRGLTETIKADIDARKAGETPAARKVRIAREVAADLAEARETPASAKPAARGMENIQDIPEAQADVTPTRTSTTEAVEPGSELKSGQRAASTTSLELKAADLLHDIIENPDKMDVVKAHEEYGEPSSSGGRPRTHPTFLDFLAHRIARANDPAAFDEIIARARVIQEDTKLTPAQKRRAGDAIGRELDRLGVEQDNLPRMMDMHDELRQEMARRELREQRGKPRETDADAALREMEEQIKRDVAEKKPRRLKSEDASLGGEGLDRATRRAIIEQLDDVNRPVGQRLEQSMFEGSAHDLHDFLDDIIQNPSARALTPHFVALARVAKKLLPRGTKVEGNGEIEHEGDYTPDTNTIRVNVDAESPTRTILHEALHTGTAHFMEHIRTKIANGTKLTPEERQTYRGLSAVAKEIDRIRQGLDTTHGEGRAAELSRQDHDELITYSLTNPMLMDLMARSDASPTLLRELRQLGMAPEGKRPSVFDAFKTAIGRIFGLKPDRVSVLDAVMHPLTQAVERGAEFRRASLKAQAEDLKGFASGELFDRGNTKLTDALPDAPLRQKLSEFGDRVAAFNHGGILQSDDRMLSKLWRDSRKETGERFSAAGGARWLRSIILPSSTTDMIARYNRDVLPEAEAIRDARARASETSLNVHAQWGDRVVGWANALKNAGDAFENLRNEVSMAQADVLHPNFEAANAHLKGDALERARALKVRFDALPADQKPLFRDLRDYHQETGWAERQAEFEYLVERVFGDEITPEQRAELGRIARSKPKLDQMVENPDGTDLAQMMADRWPAARAIMKEVAKLQRTGWMEGNFTNLQRHGDYIVSYGDPGTPERGVHFFDTQGKAATFRAQFAADHPNIEVSPVKVKSTTTTGSERFREFMPSTMETELTRALELRGIKGDEANTIMDAFTGMLMQRGAQTSAARLNIKRRNIVGASTDGARNLVRDLMAHSSRMGYLHNAAEEHRAYLQADNRVRQLGQVRKPGTEAELKASRGRLDELEQRLRAGDPEVSQAEVVDARQQHAWLEKPPSSNDVQRAGQVFDELKMRRTPIDGDDSSRIFGTIARRFTSASFVMHLMRPAHLVVQTLDAMSNAQSFMGADYGHVRTAAALTRALTHLAPEGIRAGGRNMINAVSGSMKQADWLMSRVFENRLIAGGMPEAEAKELIRAANERGLIDVSLERELQRLARPGGFGFSQGKGALSHLPSNMMDLFAAGEHAVDALNRTAILKAAYDLSKRANGGTLNDGTVDMAAITKAISHASLAMPSYGIWNKPRIATERGPIRNPLVAATMQYKIYGMHMYSVMGTLVKEAATRPGERAEALKALAGLVATHSLMVGATAQMFGVPVNMLTGLWDLIRGEAGPHNYEADMQRWMTQNLGPTASMFLSRGALGVAGVDLHRSLKLSNMVDVPELRDFSRAGVAGAFATGITGASGEVGQQLVDAAHQMFAGHFARGVLDLAPRVGVDLFKAYQLSTQGMLDARGNVIVPASRLSASTPYLRAFGFNPEETSHKYEQRNAEEEWKREINYARSQAEDRYVQSKGRDLSLVRAYNADRAFHHGYTIAMSDLQNAVKRSQGRLQRPETYGLQFSQKQLPGALAAGNF